MRKVLGVPARRLAVALGVQPGLRPGPTSPRADYRAVSFALQSLTRSARLFLTMLLTLSVSLATLGQTAIDSLSYEQIALDYFASKMLRSSHYDLPRRVHFSGYVESKRSDPRESCVSYASTDSAILWSPEFSIQPPTAIFELRTPKPIRRGIQDKYSSRSKVLRLKVEQATHIGDNVYIRMSGDYYLNRLHPEHGATIRIDMTSKGFVVHAGICN
jgi:hypothetical protein